MNDLLQVNILIIDDRPENLDVLEKILAQPGIRIFKALSGNEALALVLEHDFAVILIDIQMPVMDGFETAKLINSGGEDTDIPVIFISANRKDIKHLLRGYKAGFVDYLEKPFEPEILRAKIGVFLELQRNKISLELANKELKQAKSRVMEAGQLKREFLANMSHEIRTPMNGIIGMTDLLIETELDVMQREFAEIIKSCSDNLLTLINDILDFSRLDSGRISLENINFNLQTCLEESSELLQIRAKKKGLDFTCKIDPAVNCLLQGDPGRLRQIILNLAGNAIKFTNSGSVSVFVGSTKQEGNGEMLRFEVHDTGVGIPLDKQSILFDVFTQVDGSTTRQFGGTGLGLSICKELVEMMGGAIGVESAAGCGATFWFTVQLRSQVVAEQIVVSPAQQGISARKILVVDDDKTNRELLRILFGGWKCGFFEAVDGREALAKLEGAASDGTPFDTAIIDMYMPEMGGEILGEKIKSDPRIMATKLVMLTSIGEKGDAARLSKIGFDAYLSKPVKKSILYECLLAVEIEKEALGDGESHNIITRHSLVEERHRQSRILLADDDTTNQMVGMAILQNRGFNVDVVANGQEVLDALTKKKYKIILMDCQMPVMTGYDATIEIRKWRNISLGSDDKEAYLKKKISSVPIIAMTACAMPGDREKCLQSGMDDYIAKPIMPEELIKLLEKWLEISEESPSSNSSGQEDEFQDGIDWPDLLDRVMGNEKLAKNLVVVFMGDFAERIAELRKAVELGNWQKIIFLSHSMKGIAGNASARGIYENMLKMEKLAKVEDLVRVGSLLDEVALQFELMKRSGPGEMRRK